MWDWLKGILQKILDAILALAGLLGIVAAIDAIKAFVSTIVEKITAIAETITSGLVGNPNNINWDKLKLTGNAFTTKFPFSIPWDVGRALTAVFGSFVETDAPSWEIKFTVLGKKYSWELGFPKLMVDWQPFYKGVLLIMFDIGLVYSVRKMLGGAS